MNHHYKALRLLFFSVFFLAACSPQQVQKNPPKVTNGVIDLTGWNFEKDGSVDLDGDWLFSWKNFVEPAKWETLQYELPHLVEIPGLWHSFKDPNKPGNKLPGTGYATYGLRLRGLSGKDVLLAASRVDHAARIQVFSNQSQLLGVADIGTIANAADHEIPVSYKPIVLPLKLDASPNQQEQELIILLAVSNYHHPRGGYPGSISLTSTEEGTFDHEIVKMIRALMLGICLIIGVYHLILFTMQQGDKAALFFGIFNLSIALRIFVMGVAQSIGLSGAIDVFELLLRIEYLTLPTLCVTSAYFIKALIYTPYYHRLCKLLLFLCSPFFLLPLLSKPLFFCEFLPGYQALMMLCAVLLNGHLILMSMRGSRLAQLTLISGSFITVGVLNDLLYASGVIQTGFLSQYTTITFILLQAGTISYGNARAHEQANNLAKRLQIEIKEKEDLQASNSELENKHAKYSKLIEGISQEYAKAGKELYAAQKKQQLVNKELKDASNQLIKAEKLSGLGSMVSGITHDINNPLNFIEAARSEEQNKLNRLKEVLLQLVPDDTEGKNFKNQLISSFEELDKLNNEIKTGVKRVTEISNSMRNASRSDNDLTVDVNLVEVIDESLVITGHKVNQFQLIKNLPADIVLIACNRSQIGQVIMNFLSNAADALTEYREQYQDHKGVIQIDLAINNQNIDQKQPKTIQISVSDNGAGVLEKNRGKVLNAFFTTKAAGVGTGLGLAIAGKIAQAHNGSISIEDGLPNDHGGYGARFTLEFVG